MDGPLLATFSQSITSTNSSTCRRTHAHKNSGSKGKGIRRAVADLDLADDFEAVFSLKEHIDRHISIPVRHLVIWGQELVLDAAYCEAGLALRFHEPCNRLVHVEKFDDKDEKEGKQKEGGK